MTDKTKINDGKKRSEFIESNLMLVRSLAHRYTGKGIDYDDLYSAGCVGLIKACDNFNAELGYSFSTYAVPVILGEIRRLFRDGGTVKVSRCVKELSQKIAVTREKLANELNREPNISEIAAVLGVTAEEAAAAADSALPPMSLTYSEDGEIMDIPSGESEETLVGKIALNQALEKLGENDRKIINLRYFQDMTQSQTAKIMNMSQVAVSRREKIILARLRIMLC